MKKQDYIAEIPYRIQGIPCIIGVISYYRQAPFKGSPHLCDSDVDYYGYVEAEYDVLDRKGYYAKWLSDKMTVSDEEDVTEKIENFFESKTR